MPSSVIGGEVPAALADVLAPELPAISDEVVRTIAEEVPEYGRALQGAFGEGVRTGVNQALRRFLARVRDPGHSDAALSRVYVTLGRGELHAGRTLDALQSAYRVGARVAWRRFAERSITAGFGPETLARLAEAIFAYLDELSAESVDGYARAQSELAGEYARRRRELVEALLRDATDAAELATLAAAADWRPPRTAAALVCDAEIAPRFARRLGVGIVHASIEGLGVLVVPDAEAPGGRDRLRAAAGHRPAAIGPDGPLERLGHSWRLARGTRALCSGGQAVVWADDHLGELLVLEAPEIVTRIAEHRLSALTGLTDAARERTIRTALAYLQHRGSAPAMAGALGIHPQTARYRIRRIRDVLGEQLDRPDAHFELEAALRQALTLQAPPALGHPPRRG